MIDDLDRIMAVMGASFDPIYGEAWNRRQVEDALKFGNTHYHILCAQGHTPADNESAAGFFLSRTGFEEEELLLLAVIPESRGRGLGRKLLEVLRSGARERGAHRLLLEMRKGNPAELLYRNFGFSPIGERREYYRTPSGERLDALTFAHDIG
ncbi:GNAT family N-acetyltransferase [Novosphingobium guangzhouense]|uniref:Ribosomal-protein-alanine acetyltransferase n=1 Tax=Novosphingobium guangzhouense TaxID=1850347 RepID=A0A2K2FVV7_9SPHN|nr:GNAT family N-acetyltransferase [Novosphingobium guangzhouense]PNU02927.1 ribosomal-protein-alanine acetyltransferase [Novosphingobium guangzhouense]